jgi:PAS domain S-box-containing protein
VLLNAGSVKDSEGKLVQATIVQVDVTESQQVQEKLRESQDRLEAIVKSAMDAIMVTDDGGRIVMFNPAAEKVFGCAAQDATETLIERFIPHGLRSLDREDIFCLSDTGAGDLAPEGHYQSAARRANGQEFSIEASVSRLEIGGKKFLTLIVRDITERIRAEEAQHRLAAIVQSSDDAIVSVSVEGIIMSWNSAAERMYGYTEQEAIGRSMMIVLPKDLEEKEGQIFRLARAGEAIEHYETIRLTKAGQRRDVSVTVSPIRDSRGEVVAISKIGRDITDRKRAEASLRESEGRFRHVANTAPVMIWMSGPDKMVTYLNDPWLQFTGRPLQQELGNGWTGGVHPEDIGQCLDTYAKAFNQRVPFQMEYRLRRHDGEYRRVLDRGVPRFDAAGFFAGYIGSCIDITEHRVAQEALSGMSRKLIEAQEEERMWIARELHDDINQRIALLAVNLEALRQGPPGLEPAAGERLKELSEQVSDIVTDIQALSHHLHSSKLEYLGIVVAASSFCRVLSEKHAVEIAFRSEGIPKKLPQEIGLCLYRVLQEALQNALNHSGSRHFEVSLRGLSDAIELSVRDSGIGFEPEEVAKGQGLGLTSMRERLKLVRGELYIDAHPQGGTLIRATVPVRSAAKAAPA